MKTSLFFIIIFSLLIIMISYPLEAQDTREWTIVETYTIPGKASGLAWDGTYLYSGLYSAPGDDNLIYKIDPDDGTYVLQCAGPFASAYGLTYDGTYLWTTDHPSSSQPAIAIQFDMTGSQVSTFTLPETYFSGIAWDNGKFWACCYYDPDGMVYELNSSGTILSQFASPNDQPWSICKQDDFLWIVDYNADMIYKTDTEGNVLESHTSEGDRPAGITWDGQYLWYCDGPLSAPSTLYKVDLGGTGTPAILIPEDSHDYGTVTVGESVTWDMLVQNTGTGDLVITNLVIPSAVPIFTNFTTPQTIQPGNSITIPLEYAPTEPGALDTEIIVESNDPVDPEIPVTLTGMAVVDGPFLVLSETSHNYGNVRAGAYTRWFLEMANSGDEMLTVSVLSFNSDDFMLDEGTSLPLNIAVLDTVEVGIWFNPEEAVTYTDELSITHNGGGQNPATVDLSGTGTEMNYPIGTHLWHYNINVTYDNSPKAIASIGDITGDAIDDVIVGSEDDYIRCFNGNSHNIADVIWEHEIYSGAVYGQNSMVIVSDLTGDGIPEVVVGTAWGDRSVIALNGKTGQQLWKYDTHEYGDGGWVYQVDSRFDYNDDGINDVLAATGDDANDTGPRRIFCIDATDGSVIWDCYTDGPNFGVVGVYDFTGDGIPDAVSGSSNNAETIGMVYGINGADGEIEWTYGAVGTSVWAVEQIEDINEDGIKDIAAGDFSGHIYYLDGAAGGELESSTLGSNLIIRFEKIDDVNSDSHPDILVANSGSNALVINGMDASNVWLKSLPDKPWVVSGSNDLNGDGISDVILGTLYSNNYCFFLDGITGDELESVSFGTPVDAINAIPDITGDGSFEMVAGGRDGRVYCYSGGIHSLVAIADHNKPVGFSSRAWPNPSSGITSIDFYLPEQAKIRIEIYDVNGRIVNTIIDDDFEQGEHTVYWNGNDRNESPCRQGIYLYRIWAGANHSSGTIIRVLN